MFEFNLSFLEGIQELLSNTNLFNLIIKSILIYIAIFWFALIIWITKDVVHRSNNILFQIVIIILNTFLPIFGLVIYLLIRPSRTLLEKYYDEMELESLSTNHYCDKCSALLQNDFIFCPECWESVQNDCNWCKKSSLKTYKICPYCGKNKKVKPRKVTSKKVKK